jgi:hypothetical protein
MDYTEADLPVTLKETEVVTLADGTAVRFEENGGARDVMVNDEWSPRCTLFPGCDHMLEAGGKTYRLLAGNDDLSVAPA